MSRSSWNGAKDEDVDRSRTSRRADGRSPNCSFLERESHVRVNKLNLAIMCAFLALFLS